MFTYAQTRRFPFLIILGLLSVLVLRRRPDGGHRRPQQLAGADHGRVQGRGGLLLRLQAAAVHREGRRQADARNRAPQPSRRF